MEYSPVLVAQIHTGLLNPSRQGLFTLSNPDSWIVVLLVGLVLSIGVSNLGHDVVLFVEHKVSDTLEVCPLYRQPSFIARPVRSTRGSQLTWVSVSTFIFTTPLTTAVRISSFDEPDPPWKTRNLASGCFYRTEKSREQQMA